MDFEKLYEKLDKAGFEGFESDIIGIETFTPGMGSLCQDRPIRESQRNLA